MAAHIPRAPKLLAAKTTGSATKIRNITNSKLGVAMNAIQPAESGSVLKSSTAENSSSAICVNTTRSRTTTMSVTSLNEAASAVTARRASGAASASRLSSSTRRVLRLGMNALIILTMRTSSAVRLLIDGFHWTKIFPRDYCGTKMSSIVADRLQHHRTKTNLRTPRATVALNTAILPKTSTKIVALSQVKGLRNRKIVIIIVGQILIGLAKNRGTV